MPISATLSISSGVTGTLLSVEFQQLGRVEIKLSQKPRKHCIYGHRFPSYKCFWQVPRSRKLKNFKPRELPLHFAYGKDAEDRSLSNLSEDTDEMFDELFKKYGKVVFRRNDQKLPSAEVDDDVESLSYPLLVKAAKGHLVSRPPAWMMRQAGRYMAVYRKLAEKHPSFRERSETTDLIVQISLQPWEAFRPDGVIVFSDILTPLPAFGVPFDIDEMKGPVIQSPICLEEDLKALHPLDLEKLQFVGESLKILRKEVGDYAAVLGFVGAPWTIATYIIEGSTTRTYTTIKSMCHTAPHILRALLSHLTKAISEYIIFQVESGAHCIQIFDSWGGQLPPHMWELWSEPYIKEIVNLVRTKCPDTPLVLYINGNGGLLEQMKGTGVDVIGLDWTVDMADGRKRLGNDISVQGNVDPAFLFTPLPALTDEIRHFAVAMAQVASDVKAADIKVLFVKPLVYWTRFFIIATAFSRPQMDAIGSRIKDLAENKYGRIPTGDSKPNSWTLLDFGDVVIHIFLPDLRAFYNLEEFYGSATPIELPFEKQPPLQS